MLKPSHKPVAIVAAIAAAAHMVCLLIFWGCAISAIFHGVIFGGLIFLGLGCLPAYILWQIWLRIKDWIKDEVNAIGTGYHNKGSNLSLQQSTSGGSNDSDVGCEDKGRNVLHQSLDGGLPLEYERDS